MPALSKSKKPKIIGPRKALAKKKAAKKLAAKKVFTIDCSMPANDGILDVLSFEKYLNDRIKVNGKAGMLGDTVKVSRSGNTITVSAKGQFSKRYLKYLTKKFLKKNSIRDWLRVIADGKVGYKLKYFAIQEDADEESGSDVE